LLREVAPNSASRSSRWSKPHGPEQIGDGEPAIRGGRVVTCRDDGSCDDVHAVQRREKRDGRHHDECEAELGELGQGQHRAAAATDGT